MDEKPLVTMCIFAYNAEKYIAETIRGALNQTYDNLEIIISDDCSPDNTYSIIKETVSDYRGKHRVIINKNESNLGMIRHLNLLFGIAKGSIIATNPGDDISTPTRVSDTVSYFIDSSIQMVTFSRENIDKDGNAMGLLGVEKDVKYLINDNYLRSSSFMRGGTAVAFRKQILDTFGLLNEDAQTEDSTLRFRSLLMGSLLYSSKIGVKYRIHGGNMSIGASQYKLKTKLIAKQYYKDLNTAIDNRLISQKLYNKLIKKIKYFCSIRNSNEKIENTVNSFKKLYYRLIRETISVSYILKSYLCN